MSLGSQGLGSLSYDSRPPRTQANTPQAAQLYLGGSMGFWAGLWSALSRPHFRRALTTPVPEMLAAASSAEASLTISLSRRETPVPYHSSSAGTARRPHPSASSLDNSREPSQLHGASRVWLRTTSAAGTVLNSFSHLVQLSSFSHRYSSQGHVPINFLCINNSWDSVSWGSGLSPSYTLR